jgi:hypothetical protein
LAETELSKRKSVNNFELKLWALKWIEIEKLQPYCTFGRFLRRRRLATSGKKEESLGQAMDFEILTQRTIRDAV